MWEANYLDGKLVGKWVYYDEDGNITDEDIYENGVCVEMCE
jgi:antitoxin component YwqK of YwqJK toxin-antitoxin module